MTTDDDERIPAWRRYLRLIRPNSAGDVRDELEFHLQSTYDELVAAGMSPQAARDAAQRKFGDVDRISKTLYTLSEQRERAMERNEWWRTVRQDVGFGLRQLRKTPGFTLVALLTLALGIGANSAIFSVVYSVILRPLPYENGERVLALWEKSGQGSNSVTLGNYESWRQQATSFEAIGGLWYGVPLTLTGQGDPAPIATIRARADLWKVMYMPPVIGRYIDATEERVGAPDVVVLSEALWRNRFQANPGILGKPIMLGGKPHTVVGVAPADYILAGSAEQVWVPLIASAAQLNDHSDHELTVYGLVKKGVPVERAIAELSSIERNLATQYPKSGFDDVDARRLADSVIGPNRSLIFTLFGAVGLVLLIACANVANLLLARATKRRGELAIRGALGASRGRIVSQLLIENLILGMAGGVLGLGVAYAGIRFLVTSPASIPRLQAATLNGPVVAFTIALAAGCAIVFGLLPALRAARLDLQQTLRDGGRESAVSSRDTLRGGLVVAELVLTQVLLIGAGLLIRSQLAAMSVQPGFDTRNLLVANVFLPSARYQNHAALESGFRRIDEAIAAIPGVTRSGRANLAPIHGGGWNCAVMREGSTGHDDRSFVANMRGANATYFSAIGVPLLRGRAFTSADVDGAAPVAIINRSLARDLFGEADPLGRLVSSCTDGKDNARNWRQVVGVIGDMRAGGLTETAPREYYMPSDQWAANNQMAIVVRGGVPVAQLVPAIRKAVAAADPLLALSRVRTMDESIKAQLALPRFTMWLLMLLGATGLILAIVGVYGVIAFLVSQRTHEFGVRMALGASGGAVQWMVVRQGLVLGAIGVAVGTVAAYGLSRFLGNLMYDVTAHDPLTYVVVAVALALVTACASFIPARRATRIDPLEALRRS